MKILMLTPRLPYPPNRGDAIRAWSELEFLAQRHDVWLACVEERQPYPNHLAHVREICRDVVVAARPRLVSLTRGGLNLLRGRSLTEGFFGSMVLDNTLATWSADVRFDAILTFSSAMAPFAERVAAKCRVLDMNDVDSDKWTVYARRSRMPLRWLYALEARRLAAAERRCTRTHDVALLVNERERRKLAARAGRCRSDVVRTCIEVVNQASSGAARRRPPLPPGSIVGSVGSMFYPPNVRAVEWFGRNVWGRIRAALPDARWWIVGNRPTRKVRRWGNEPGVTVTGFVPDIRPYLEAIRVFVNAVDGDIGVQTKLLGAMATGKPAVVTPDSAAGIDYNGEPPFLIARTPEEFADAVVLLLSDKALAERLSTRARQTIETYYQPEAQLLRIEQWLAGRLPTDSGAQSELPGTPDEDSNSAATAAPPNEVPV